MGGEPLSAIMGEKQNAVADSQQQVLKMPKCLFITHKKCYIKYTPSDLMPQVTSLQVTSSSGSQDPYLHCFCSGPDTRVSAASQVKSRVERSGKAESE